MGFNAEDSSPEIDRKIFIFLTLICSLVMFNNSNCLDEDLLYKISGSIEEIKDYF
jgi:hypothetical protein